MTKKRLLKNGSYIVNSIKTKNNISTTIEISSGDISFFRYRTCSDFSLDALMKDQFWVSNATTFNDPYDTSLTYNSKKLHTKLAEIKGQNVGNMTTNDFNELHYFVNDLMKRNYYIACLSEKIDNSPMWAHYSNNGTGFALEYNYTQMEDVIKYNLDDLLQYMFQQFEINHDDINDESYRRWIEISGSFFPMFYTNDSMDFTEKIIDEIERKGLNDILMVNNKDEFLELFNMNLDDETFKKGMTMKNSLATTKNRFWSYEKEWRLKVPSITPNQDHTAIALVRPNAIYLGEFISDINKIFICKVAKAKNIDIYQMYSNHSLKGNKLKYKKITDKELEEILSLHIYDFTKYDEEL